MVAEDVVFGNQLHTGMRFSVVEQQTVASIQLQHSRLTKRLTFRNCPALISMSI